MASGYFYKHVLLFAAMVAAECASVGLSTIFKAASLKGMSYYVFIFYTTLINTLVLLPIPFLLCRSTRFPLLQFSVISGICLVGTIGCEAAMGVVLLGDALHLGSVIGAAFISIGFYALIWGKLKEEQMIEECGSYSLESSVDAMNPLLQSHKFEDA